jgi:pyridoxamine 5'-phosphate oxidase
MTPPPDPFSRFRELYAQAEQAYPLEFNSMMLATVGPHARPRNRVVLLKALDERGFVFYTNLDSRKAEDLKHNPWASLGFWWPKTEYQVRIDGKAEQVSAEEADAYFATRPRGSQVGAWASKQSQPLPSRQLLEEEVRQAEARFEGKAVPRPPNWGGYRVVPVEFEFWRNRDCRLHDREVYVREREDAAWSMVRLYP